MNDTPVDISRALARFKEAVHRFEQELGATPHKTRYDEPSPGDVGRFAIHHPAATFAKQLAQWCGDSIELNDVAAWMEAVAKRLREIRDSL